MSNNQLKLLDPLNSNDQSASTKAFKGKDNTWYNIPFSLKEDDDNDITPRPTFSHPIQLAIAITLTAFVIITPLRKEYLIEAKIKAIYMLKEKKLAREIKKATNVSRTRVYALFTIAKKCS